MRRLLLYWILIIISRHRWNWFHHYRSVSVSLIPSCIVLKHKKLSTRFLLRTTAPCLSQIKLKFGLYRSTPSLFALKWSKYTCWFKRRRHSMANWGRMVRYSAMESYRKLSLLSRMLPSLTPYDLPFSQNRGPMYPSRPVRDACCHLANMVEDIDKLYGVPNEPSDVAFCHITSVLDPCSRSRDITQP